MQNVFFIVRALLERFALHRKLRVTGRAHGNLHRPWPRTIQVDWAVPRSVTPQTSDYIEPRQALTPCLGVRCRKLAQVLLHFRPRLR